MYKSYINFKKALLRTKPLDKRKTMCRQYILQQCSSILDFKFDSRLKTMEDAISSLEDVKNLLNRKRSANVWEYIEKLDNEIQKNNEEQHSILFTQKNVIAYPISEKQTSLYMIVSKLQPIMRCKWFLYNKKFYGNL